MADPISPAAVTHWQPQSLPPYLSNGCIGLRLGQRPLAPGVAVLNGLEGIHPGDEVPGFGRVPYPLGGDVVVGEVRMSDAPDRCTLREQRYDFSAGEVTTSWAFDGGQARVELTSTVLCSRTQPGLVLELLTARVDRSCRLELTASVETVGVPGRDTGRKLDLPGSSDASDLVGVDGVLRWSTNGDLTTGGIAYATSLTPREDVQRTVGKGVDPLVTTYAVDARPGVTYRLRRIAAAVPDVLHPQPEVHAVRLLRTGAQIGFDRLRDDNRREWDDLWRARPELLGAPTRWQAMADAAFYYVHSSTHRSSPASTSLFGLAYWPNYHYYRGHVMWDIETFVVPPLLLSAPDAARGLLTFRHLRRHGARTNAAMGGFVGLQYPWEASPSAGAEASPVEGAAPGLEHHVSMDVALAFARYVHATGDVDFAREQASPVLAGVAEWLTSRLDVEGDAVRFRRVNGVAETGVPVDENAFVNMAAIRALREAAALRRRLGEPYPDEWEDLADRLPLPTGRRGGGTVVLNHKGFRRDEDKAATPEALAGFWPLDHQVAPSVQERTTRYYLSMASEYVGAPMLSATLGVHAARTGDRAAALEWFERGYAEFVLEPFTITAEFSPKVFPEQPVAGPFAANLGGFLSALLYGLPGIRLHEGEPSTWCEREVVLPTGWDAIRVGRVWARNEPAELVAEHGRPRATLRQ